MAHISEAAPLQISRFYTGWYSYRNPLIVPIRQMGRRIIELYDSISDGLNMELSNRLTLVRRPGYTPVNSTPVHGRALNFYTFKPSNFPGQVYNLADTTVDVEWLQSGSATPPQVILQKQIASQTTFAQVGAFLYMANEHFLKKWDSPAGIQGVTNWGIDITAAEGSTGFRPPQTSQNQPLPGNPSAPPWQNPTGVVGHSASVSARRSTPRLGEYDLLQWMGLSSRATNHLTGDLWEAVMFDTDPGYPSNYPPNAFFWIKNVQGNPWDIMQYSSSYAAMHWITENGDAPDQPYCVNLGYPSCWMYARAYKRFLTPVPLIPRYYTPGVTVTIDTPGPNTVNRTVDCEQNLSAVIHLGDVRAITSGPVNYAWGGSIDSGAKPGANGPQPGNTPTIVNEYFYSGQIALNNFKARETTYYVQGFGRVAWYYHTLSGANWVLQNFKVNSTVTAGGAPAPNFPCGPGRIWWPPLPTPLPSGFSLAVSTSTATIAPGAPANVTITVVPVGGFSQPVTLSVAGVPAGVFATFNVNPITTSSTLTLTTTNAPVTFAVISITGSSPGYALAVVNVGLSIGVGATPPNPPPEPTPPTGMYVTLARPTAATAQGPQASSSWLGLWQHNQNAAAQDGNFATQNLVGCQTSPAFIAGGFNFSLPANAVISGITAQVFAQMVWALNPSVASFELSNVQLSKAGVPVGENRSSRATYTGAIANTYGGGTDLWGTSWTASDVNNARFGIQLEFTNTSTVELTMGIDFVALTVDYVVPEDNSTLVSQWVYVRTFGNALAPPAPPYVTGFKIGLGGLETVGDGIGLNVGLTTNGSLVGETRFVELPANGSGLTLGGSNDMWGTALTTNDVNQVDFGVAIQAVNTSAISAQFNVTAVYLEVFYIYGPDVQPITGGQLNPETGYQYVYAYGNSVTGHVSSPTYPSITVGPQSYQNIQVQVGLTASPDPQVNEIHVYRTTDGGGQPFFELPNSPFRNQSQTITDNALDWQLQIASIAPQLHFNDPPPPGAIDPVWFGGRLWLHSKNTLFFASGPDVTAGVGEEAWYPAYAFSLPGEIVRKFPTPNGMLVFTQDATYIVRGISTASFTVNDFMQNIGMKSWNAGDTDGSNAYIYSSDKQLLLMNPNGVTSISQSIADQIMEIDPAQAYLTMFRYTAMQNYLFLSDGATFVYAYNVELQAWGLPQAPVGGVGAIGRVETSPGVWEFWRSRPVTGSLISRRDISSFRDEGYAYPCYAIFGPVPVADFLTLAQVRDVVLTTSWTTSRLLFSLLANEINPIGAKQWAILDVSSPEPPMLAPSLSFRANRYSVMTSSIPELANFVFLRADFSADANPDEMFSWTLGGTQTTGGSALGAPGQLPQIQGR